MSCASWMGRALLFRVASGTKLLGVSSKHDILAHTTTTHSNCLLYPSTDDCRQQLFLLVFTPFYTLPEFLVFFTRRLCRTVGCSRPKCVFLTKCKGARESVLQWQQTLHSVHCLLDTIVNSVKWIVFKQIFLLSSLYNFSATVVPLWSICETPRV